MCMRRTQRNIQNWLIMPRENHAVAYYPSNHVLINSLYKYISQGVALGDSCLIISRPAIINSLRPSLARGMYGKGTCTLLSAESVLEDILTDGMPDKNKFSKKIEKILSLNTKPRQKVRIYGEMGAMLLEQSGGQAVSELERLWSEYGKSRPLSLYCGYPLRLKNQKEEELAEIDNQHKLSAVLPPSLYN